MSKTRAFLEMAARFRPKMEKPVMRRPTSNELAKAERRSKVMDPYEEEIMAAQGAPEVHGHRALTYHDPARPSSADPQPLTRTGAPGHGSADGSDDHGW